MPITTEGSWGGSVAGLEEFLEILREDCDKAARSDYKDAEQVTNIFATIRCALSCTLEALKELQGKTDTPAVQSEIARQTNTRSPMGSCVNVGYGAKICP